MRWMQSVVVALGKGKTEKTKKREETRKKNEETRKKEETSEKEERRTKKKEQDPSLYTSTSRSPAPGGNY